MKIKKPYARIRCGIKKQLRAEVNAFKNVPCADCKLKFHHAAMDFDHVRGPKKGCVSEFLSLGKSRSVVLAEIAKCDVVCACCHRLRTFRRKLGRGAIGSAGDFDSQG